MIVPSPQPLATAPGRTVGDVRAAQVGLEAKAKDTDLAKRRVAAAEKNAQAHEANVTRMTARDKEMKERIGATLKTMEAQIVDTARRAFPDDPQKQLALAARLRNRLVGFQAMLSGDKDAATIEQDIKAEVAKMKGEVAAIEAGAPKAEVDGWFRRLRDSVAGTIGGRAPKPAGAAPALGPPAAVPAPRALPGRGSAPAAAPAPQDLAALKAARDALVNGLYPGRAWPQLTPEEKQEVSNRLQGAR